MRVVFMGTPDFAVGTLQALIGSRHEVTAVVTQPDKPKGRGKAMQFTPVKEVAVQAGIPVYQPRRVREESFLEELLALAPEVIVVVAFGQIIPQAVLDLPKYGCINVHASLLPKYRGAAPIQWAVIDGEEVSGVTTMQMDAGLDTGDMLLKAEVALDAQETGGSLFEKLSSVGARLLLETLDALESGTAAPEKQPQESPTAYAAMFDKKMGLIDWSSSAVKIERLVRGLNPWPSAYTHLGEKTLKIWRAHVELPGLKTSDMTLRDGAESMQMQSAASAGTGNGAAPGTVVRVTPREIAVAAGDGLVVIDELQLEGKKRMETDAFLRGFALHEGEVLK